MVMTDAERELVSVAASVAAGCELCTDVHVRDARRARASDDEIARSISVALDVREEATRVMERRGLKALGRRLFSGAEEEGPEPGSNEPSSRIEELMAVGAAYAANCESILERRRAAASSLGATEEELEAVVRLSKFIKGKAESLCCKWI